VTDETAVEAYLEAADGDGSRAAAGIMDRLAERLKNKNIGETLTECEAAAAAIVEIAEGAEKPTSVINQAVSTAGDVARRSNTKKELIADPLREASEELRLEEARGNISLDDGYGFDKYLEKNLIRVEKQRSTDHNNDTVLRWVFDDADPTETDNGLPFENYGFWKELNQETDKKLLPEFASEEIGDPDEDPQYAKLSIGPESRPWAEDNYISCLNDLIDDRVEHVERTGPRTEVWEAVCRHIGRSRAVTDLEVAVSNRAVHAYCEDGDLAEIWVPTATINSKCSEHDVEPRALQNEAVARGADSDDVAGGGISAVQNIGGNTERYWRLDASHAAVPEPDEIVDELTAPTDSIEGMDWGDADE
jgi:hypothetical protein